MDGITFSFPPFLRRHLLSYSQYLATSFLSKLLRIYDTIYVACVGRIRRTFGPPRWWRSRERGVGCGVLRLGLGGCRGTREWGDADSKEDVQ